MCEGEKEARERGQLLHGLQNPQGTETMKKKNQFDSNFQRKKRANGGAFRGGTYKSGLMLLPGDLLDSPHSG